MTSSKWNQRWLDVAEMVATWSKDPSTKVGAVLFHSQDNVPLAFGYNGLARGVSDDDNRLQNRELKYSLTVHAEANALLNALRSGATVKGSTLMVTHPPCTACAALIIQAGVSHVMYKAPNEDYLSRWDTRLSDEMFAEAGVTTTKI